MKPNLLIKRVVDAAMYVLFVLLMGQCVLRGAVHEWLGIAIGVLFVLHNVLNISWYRALFKGRYSAVRVIQTVIIFLLILAVLFCMVSGVLVSQHIFAIGSGSAIEFGRHLHLVATAWAFVLMTLHLGLHWSVFAAIAKKLSAGGQAKKGIYIICCIFAAALCGYGLYQFVDRRFWEELFHLIDYQKEYDYTQPLPVYFVGTLALSAPFIALGHYAKAFLLRTSKPRTTPGREKMPPKA